MKIIHCADLHLDSKMTANLSKEKAKERKAELLNTFQEMVRYGVEHQVKAILIAGDLYDTKNISATARNIVYNAIINHPHINFYYLKGNHDADSFLGSLEEVPQNLYMFQNQWTTYVANENTGRNILITAVELDKDNSESIYNTLTLDADQFNIVMLHGQESETLVKDKTESIHLKRLRNKGIDYLALGHVHAYKVGELDSRGTYCYSGCLEGRGFDECGEHGFVLLDIDEEKGEWKQEFVPIAYRKLYELEVDISDCMSTSEIAERIKVKLEEVHYDSKSLVKILLKGDVNVECEKNIEVLVKGFENYFYFLKIYDESSLRVDYRQFSLDESLKGEFVRTVMRVSDLDEEDKATIIRYGLQALAGEEIQ